MSSIKSVCILGLGYIGLPTASMLAHSGLRVLGVDINPQVVDTINQGCIHIEEPGLQALVQAVVHSGNLRAALQPGPADAFVIAVPTPITHDKRADMSYVEAAARLILPYLKAGDLVLLESTSPPRTTEDILAPILAESGLTVGKDLFLAYSPERVLPGRILKELVVNSRVIGGLTPASAERGKELYAHFVEGEIFLTDATTAEMVKLMENTYRDVNIALANELAVMSGKLGISAWDVIRLANHHPRVHLHSPGPGVGGHCISVDPWFLVEQLPDDARIITTARQTNDSMPHRVSAFVKGLLQSIEKPKVTVLGVTYKGNVDDTRESPALEVIADLKAAGVEVSIYDPHITQFAYALSERETAFAGSDCIVLLTDHQEFTLLDPSLKAQQVRRPVVVDTRKALDESRWREAGFECYLLGRALLPSPTLSHRIPKAEANLAKLS